MRIHFSTHIMYEHKVNDFFDYVLEYEVFLLFLC